MTLFYLVFTSNIAINIGLGFVLGIYFEKPNQKPKLLLVSCTVSYSKNKCLTVITVLRGYSLRKADLQLTKEKIKKKVR